MFLSPQEKSETINACRFCMMCHVADRVPKFLRRESYTPRGRGAILSALERGLLEWDPTIANIMYTTLNDGLLREWCVGNYDHEELVIDARARLFSKGLVPEEVSGFVKDLHQRPYAGRSPQEILGEAGVKTRKGADYLIFAGCVARQGQSETLVSLGRLFERAGVAFQVLAEEPCCGWPLYQLGDWEGSKEFSKRISKKLKSAETQKVVVIDADCMRMLNTRNARFGGDVKGIKFTHALTLLADWLDQGMIKVKKPLRDLITYHDPCALARFCPDIESPRRIIKAIAGKEMVEMTPSGKFSACCGAGGMLPVYRPELARQVADQRLQEALETGAAVLATGCSRCTDSFCEAQKDKEKKGPLVRNLIELVGRAASSA